MEPVLLVIHLMLALGIIGVVLLQPSESGGFMGNSGSMSNLGAPRRSADALTRTTAILAGCFFCTSLFLAIAAGNTGKPKSILDLATDDKAAVTAPVAAEAKKADAKKPAEPKQPKAPVSQ
jgi:preprotein translocase subunit SecG